MSISASSLLKYSPLAIGVTVLAISAFFVPWREVVPYFSRLNAASYVFILLFGIGYYVTRIVRYHYMLGVLKAPQSFFQTVIAYFTAQPIALLPGGETYRVVTLKKRVKVPTIKGVSVVFIQSFTENLSLVMLALICAVLLKQQILIIAGLLLLYIIIFLLLRTRRTAENSRRLINKIPFVSIAADKYHSFIRKNKTLLSGKSLVVIFLSGFISSLFMIALLFIVAGDLNVELSFTEATVVYTLPTVLQNVSFLPGGIGVNEQGTVGILLLFGSSLPAAVALTLIMRFVTLVLGVLLGLLCMMISAREG